MAVDWSDTSQVENFKFVAKSKGIPVEQIDGYIKSKTSSPVVVKPTPEPKREFVGELAGTPLTKPTPTPQANVAGSGRITQNFGNPNAKLYGTKNGRANINRGVDISADPGAIQTAPSSGKWVVESVYDKGGWNTGWGNSVVIRNTESGETIRRSHFDKVLAKPGQDVTGKPLGTTGRTGRTTGYHQDVEYTNSDGRLSDYTKSKYY